MDILNLIIDLSFVLLILFLILLWIVDYKEKQDRDKKAWVKIFEEYLKNLNK